MKFMLLTGLWATLMVGAFWKFEGSYLVPVKPKHEPSAKVHSQALTGVNLDSYRGQLVLLNFWDPNCACTEFTEPHVRHIAEKFPTVKVITVVIGSREQEKSAIEKARNHRVPGEFLPDRDGKLCERFGIPAAPAAVIIDPSGKMAYRGGYNIGRFCDNASTAFAEQALAALTIGKQVPQANIPFYGCHTGEAK